MDLTHHLKNLSISGRYVDAWTEPWKRKITINVILAKYGKKYQPSIADSVNRKNIEIMNIYASSKAFIKDGV